MDPVKIKIAFSSCPLITRGITPMRYKMLAMPGSRFVFSSVFYPERRRRMSQASVFRLIVDNCTYHVISYEPVCT